MALAGQVAERTLELSTANQALTASMKERDEFVAIVTHEFRTPLTVIFGLSELMRDINTDTEAEDLLHKTWSLANGSIAYTGSETHARFTCAAPSSQHQPMPISNAAPSPSDGIEPGRSEVVASLRWRAHRTLSTTATAVGKRP